MYFKCDPEKNIFCKKKTCFINGGNCSLTTDIAYAKNPHPLGIDEGWAVGNSVRNKVRKETKKGESK